MRFLPMFVSLSCIFLVADAAAASSFLGRSSSPSSPNRHRETGTSTKRTFLLPAAGVGATTASLMGAMNGTGAFAGRSWATAGSLQGAGVVTEDVARSYNDALQVPSSRPTRKSAPSAAMDDPSSVQRAIEQLHAILDVYNATTAASAATTSATTTRAVAAADDSSVGAASGSIISGDLALNVLEGVVIACLRNPHTLTDFVLEQLEDLVLVRFGDVVRDLGAPSEQVLNGLWMMQQYNLQTSSQREEQEKVLGEALVKPSREVGRSIRLLSRWYEWEARGAIARRPPDSYLMGVLNFALQRHVTMSFAIWDLYRHLTAAVASSRGSSDLKSHPSVVPPRELYGLMISLLSISSSEWRIRQCGVVRDMLVCGRTLNDVSYEPTVEELREVYKCATKSGRVKEAAWLLRLIREKGGDVTGDCRLQFLQGLARSNDTEKATSHMERLLLSSGDSKWCELGRDSYNMLLQKWLASKNMQDGAGMRAQAVFEQMLQKYRETGAEEWKPDELSVYLVVMSHLRDPKPSLSHVTDAEKFLRTCVEAGLLRRPRLADPSQKSASWRIFDRLLGAYCSRKYNGSEEGVRVAAADKLFQYFLVQHRQGSVDEAPDRYHLTHILRLFNYAVMSTAPNHASLSAALAATKSLEYFRLIQKLSGPKGEETDSAPDVFNVRQLLGTLALSEQAGHGQVSNELLQEILLRNETTPLNAYALGHTFWCVIKCNCRDGGKVGLRTAVDVLRQMEAIYAGNRASIRLTGASYQTILKAVAAEKERGDWCVDYAEEVIERIEKQCNSGNRRARLTKKLYSDAIKCCLRNPSDASERLVADFRSKIERTCT